MSQIQPQMLADGTLLTGEFVGSFVNVFQMRQYENNAPEYAVTMMFDPSDPTVAMLAAMINKVVSEKWGANVPHNLYTPILDGNLKAAQYPEMAGKYTIKANNKNRKPLVIDRNKDEVMDPGTIYSGCKFRAIVDCYAYDKGSNGVAIGLKVLQKTEDGTPFSGSMGDPSLIPALPPAPMPQAMPQQAMPQQAMPQQAMPQQAMPQQAMPQQAMPQQAMPQQAMPQAMPQQAMPQAMPQQAMPQQAMPQQAMPQAMPQQAMPQQAMPQQGQPAGGQGFVPTPNGNIDLNNF